MDKRPINILIADSQFLTREALKDLLGEKFSVVTFVDSREELVAYLEKYTVALIILDYKLFDFDSPDEIANLKNKYPQVHILILSNYLTQEDISGLSAAGIKNFLLKTADETEFFRAIDSTLEGKKCYSDELLDLIIDSKKKSRFDEPCALTSAEMEIVKLIAEGLTTKEIASGKFISFHTVMTHRKNIFRKLGVTSASELIMFAIRKGWIDNIEYYI